MSTRIDRYQAAVMLAQLILEGGERHDDFRIQQALGDIWDEVHAGRKNQREFPAHMEQARKLVEEAFSVRAPELRLVTDSEDAA